MEEPDIKQLWKAYDIKLERSLQLNYKILKEIQTQKAENNINSFKRSQVFGVVGGILWILFLVFLVAHGLNNPYYAISIGLIAIFNIFAVATYIRHLDLLSRINIADSITESQQKLASIQTSLINVGRILILQTPLYCTFYYSNYLVEHAGTLFWVIQFIAVSFFTVVSVYLFNILTYKNIHRKWVRAFIESFGGKQLSKAMEFLSEIEDYKQDKTAFKTIG